MGYEKVNAEDLILRDYLALDRTMLANERTFLAYQRTALMLLISGATVLKVFPDNRAMDFLGGVLLPFGLIVAVFGHWRFFSVRNRILRAGARSRGDGA